MKNQLLKKSVMVEMSFDSTTQTTFPFPDVPFLRHKKITGICLSMSQICPTNGKSNITPVITDINNPDFRSVFATFVDNNGIQFLQNIPLVEFCPIGYENSNISIGGNENFISNKDGFFKLAPRAINFPKSYIFIPAGIPAGYGLCIQFFYDDNPLPLVRSDIFEKIFNFQFVSLQVNTLGARYYFSDQPNLRDAKISKIHVYFPSVIPTDPNRVNIMKTTYPASSVAAKNSMNFLTLHNNGIDLVKQLDLNYFSAFTGNSNFYLDEGSFNIDNIVIDFSKSYVESVPQPNGPVYQVPFVYGFGIFYTK